MKKLKVQETLIRETEIEIEDDLYEQIQSDDLPIRTAAQLQVCAKFDAAVKNPDANSLEWCCTDFLNEEGFEIFDVS